MKRKDPMRLRFYFEIVRIFLLLLIMPLIQSGSALAGTPPGINEKIQLLKDTSLSSAQKGDVSREIQKEGKRAIPFLIDCVKDSTPIAKTPLTGGECVNLPVTAKPPPHCKNPVRNETLGERCESLLYNILTPSYTSPYMAPVTSKQASPSPFVIPDWKTWWGKYGSKSLDEIQEEARKKIDEFWQKGHGQSVVWID